MSPTVALTKRITGAFTSVRWAKKGDSGLTSGRARRRVRSRGPAAVGSYLDSVMQYVDSELDAAVERMITLGHPGSVASEGAVAAEERAHAEMFVDELRNIGFTAGVRDTPWFT